MDNNTAVDKAAIDDNISRTVDKTALRKVRRFVDEFESNERSEKSRQFWMMLSVIVFAIVVLMVAVKLTGSARTPQKVSVGDRIAECTSQKLYHFRAEHESELRRAHPNLTDAEIASRLKRDAGTIYHAARQRCAQAHEK